ncbi:MAG: GNAT family N-acetyltransferase [Flavobacteriaceae bacterium]
MSQSKIKIRAAVSSDLKILKEFEQEVIRYERSFAKNLKQDPIVYYKLEDYIERSDVQVLVATLNDKAVGSGYAMIKDSEPFKTPEKYVYLGFMFVVPEQRGKGINGLIINELLNWVKEKKLTEVQLDVYAENESAISAYEKIGFKSDLLKMRLRH